ALVGFDDLELGEMLAVPVTVVAYDAAELGRAAAELLADRLAGDDGPRPRIVLPTTPISRRPGAGDPGGRTPPPPTPLPTSTAAATRSRASAARRRPTTTRPRTGSAPRPRCSDRTDAA